MFPSSVTSLSNMASSAKFESAENLDKHLRQKLGQLESAVARVASTRIQLRDNADLVKTEVRSCFGHQLSCLRSREQQLLANLDTVVTVKDEILTEQQDQLHQALGACQQGLQCLSKAVDDMKRKNSAGSLDAVEQNLVQILGRLSSVEMIAREAPHIAFEVDQMMMRRTLQTFGRISTSRAAKHCESLPADMEDYEDGEHSLSHKPFHMQRLMAGLSPRAQIPRDASSSLLKEALTGDSHSNTWNGQSPTDKNQVCQWLHHIKTQVETEPTVFDDFGLVRRRKSTDSTAEGSYQSSFETISQSLFSGYFQQVMESPMEQWVLKPDDEQQTMTETTNSFIAMDLNDRENDFSTESAPLPANANRQNSTTDPDIEGVFTSIKDSDNSLWLISTNDQPAPMSGECLLQLPSYALLANDSPTYKPTANQEEPAANDPGVDTDTYESVLGWQALLERIHSGDQQWLVKGGY